MNWPPPPPPPPPPTPPPRSPLEPLPSVVLVDRRPPAAPSPSISLSPSLFIIAAIIVVVVVTSFCIHLLLRLLSCRRRSSSAVAALPLPLVATRSASGGSSSAAREDSTLSDRENAALIESLPVFTLASALASLPKSSPECAVCLCPFRPDDELRLLPACCHAFHSSCVDPWLHSTPSCPLCRASISLPAAPLQLPLTLAAPPSSGDRDASRSGSFRIEIGSVSRRRASSGEEPGNPPPPASALPQHLRTYSIGSSFEYLVEEEVEAVVARIARRMEKVEKQGDADTAAEIEPAPPGEGVAEAAGGGGGRGWLKEYVDRLASSASSSFSSLRFSGRWSHRYEGEGGGAIAAGHNAWELEGSVRREAEEGGYYGFYRWLIGA